ncbi:serine/threonine-protein kinase [Roseiflexus castenholzii]|jgi:serine/threonine-protein kinase|uniref:non-specific serine/threonine protein kinase n=1 Tax=Roseiflexus castenholzii (strain DSM 13941 / HLO8) TaxID=383372 RepID=A7NGV9_ROSCS|nr:serine/threonine-protein kinase [Roseiflexus castenholzii]ABU56706.1 serine/threonine protein kinase [Roseiflexus castenholzii DSM 13941]
MSATTPLIGATIGNYEIQALIGSGGMATVYRGFDHNLGRAVAIKILSEEARAHPGFVDRFRQEARIIANLRHPNIVQVYDFGVHNGMPYMVQELLPGPTLEQRITDAVCNGRPLSLDEIVAITRQLAAALDAAHAAGVIHRDVKPANAMWNALGSLVLTDFGIARNMLASGNQTQVGMVVGTPGYLSPEQAQGLPVTPASDIYSLGVVVFEMLAGRLPFNGDTPMSIAIQHIQTPPPPLRTLRSDIPPAIEAVVLRALAKDPAARFERAEQFAAALERACLTSTPGVAATAIHQQATAIWQSGGAAVKPASPSIPAAASAPPVVETRASPKQERRFSLLPLLGGAFALLLLVGAFLAMRGSGSTAGQIGDAAPTAPLATVAPTAASAATPAPEVAIPPPDTPVAPTTAPPPTPIPPATPVSPPAPPVATGSALADLRSLLTSVASEGRSRRDAQKWLRTLEEFEREIGRGEARKAQDKLRELQRELTQAEKAGKLSAEASGQALQYIQTIANAYGIDLGR